MKSLQSTHTLSAGFSFTVGIITELSVGIGTPNLCCTELKPVPLEKKALNYAD